MPGTKTRMPLFDEHGGRIQGKENKIAAEVALAKEKLTWADEDDAAVIGSGQWLVARVCSDYNQSCQKRAAKRIITDEYRDEVDRYLNEFCRYCGSLPAAELRNGHVQHWVESHPSWRSPVTQRNAMAIVLAAFNHAQEMHDVPNPLGGLKKPPPRPRMQSFTTEEEQLIYSATDEPFGDFLFAAIHTGLRPFCELARLTADDVAESPRGMMWRVYSTKTKKTRKVPIRSEVAELTRRLMAMALPGSGKAVFRNPQGRPWKKVTGVSRFLKIKREL